MGNKVPNPPIHSTIYIDCCNSFKEHNSTQDIADGSDLKYHIRCCCFKLKTKEQIKPCDEVEDMLSMDKVNEEEIKHF
jgi:hypothetical protein